MGRCRAAELIHHGHDRAEVARRTRQLPADSPCDRTSTGTASFPALLPRPAATWAGGCALRDLLRRLRSTLPPIWSATWLFASPPVRCHYRAICACGALSGGGAGRAVRWPRPAVMVRAWGFLRQLPWLVRCMASRLRYELHRPRRGSARGSEAAGGVPAGDDHRAGWLGQDPAGWPGGPGGGGPVRRRSVAGRAGGGAGPGAGGGGGRGARYAGAAGILAPEALVRARAGQQLLPAGAADPARPGRTRMAAVAGSGAVAGPGPARRRAVRPDDQTGPAGGRGWCGGWMDAPAIELGGGAGGGVGRCAAAGPDR